MKLSNPHQNFRKRLLSGELLVGTFVKTPSMIVAEVLAQTRLDIICFDAEHAPFDRGTLDASLVACRAACQPSLARVPTFQDILNALDCGATGVLVPHIYSATKAREIVDISRFGKMGHRAYAGSTRAAGYGARSIAENLALDRTTTVIAQIEDPQALSCLESIMAIEGIDCFYIGMADLAVGLGAKDIKATEVIEAAESICSYAQSIGRRTGIFCSSPEDIPFWIERGVSLFILSSDHLFLKQGANQLADQLMQYKN